MRWEGYRGRIGVFEVLEMGEEMRKLVSRSATTEEVEALAKKDGMISMIADGFAKAAQGLTTIEEVRRSEWCRNRFCGLIFQKGITS